MKEEEQKIRHLERLLSRWKWTACKMAEKDPWSAKQAGLLRDDTTGEWYLLELKEATGENSPEGTE